MTFHLSIAREVLSAALGRAALCATTRMSIPVLGSVKLEPCEGGLRVTTTNFDQTLTQIVPGQVEQSEPICLPVKRLVDVVNALPPGAVSIRGDASGRKAVVTGGRTRLELYGFSAEEFPAVPSFAFDGNLGLDAKAFAADFSQLGVHCSTADSRPALKGVLLDSRDDGLFLTAMDGAMGARVKFAPPVEPRGSWILPRAAAPAITRLFASVEEPLRISFSTAALRLTTEGVQLDLRLIGQQYPAYAWIFDRSTAKSIGAVDAELLKAAIQRAVAIGDVKTVVFTWYADRLELRSQSENGVVNDEIPCRYSGEQGLTIGLDGGFLTSAIASIAADDLRFYVMPKLVNIVDAAKDVVDRDAVIATRAVRVEPDRIAA